LESEECPAEATSPFGDFADEVEAELLAARRSLVRNDARVEALEALLDTVWTLTRRCPAFGRGRRRWEDDSGQSCSRLGV
jgi:hypothetical protein